MKNSMKCEALTADGIKLVPGLSVWTCDQSKNGELVRHIVASISEDNRIATMKDGESFRLNMLFALGKSATEHYESQFVHLRLDPHSACLIPYALAQRLKAVRQEVEILRLTRERELTDGEKYMLPSHLQPMSRGELREQLDPWVSLADDIEWLMGHISEKIVKVEGRE